MSLLLFPTEDPTGGKKQKTNTTPHWKALVAFWVSFYSHEDRFGLEPSFEGPDTRALQSILRRLKKHSENSPKSKDQEWSESYAKRVFAYFLELAYKDPWRQRNFRLPVLSSHFDTIITSNAKPTTATRTEAANAHTAGELARYYAERSGDSRTGQR